jgi:hypothetical protein
MTFLWLLVRKSRPVCHRLQTSGSTSAVSRHFNFGNEGNGRVCLFSRPPSVNFDACRPEAWRSIVRSAWEIEAGLFADIGAPAEN